MKLVRTIAMHTDYNERANPVETSAVSLFISDDIVEWTPEMLAKAKQNQEMKLHSMAKRMPNRYWMEMKERG